MKNNYEAITEQFEGVDSITKIQSKRTGTRRVMSKQDVQKQKRRVARKGKLVFSF